MRELITSQLGDPELAVARIRPLLALPQLAQDDLPRWTVLSFAAQILVDRGDSASLDEAEQILIDGRIGVGFVYAWALATRVRARLRRGHADESMAREAHAFVLLGPRGAVGTVAPLVRVLLAKDRPSEAAEIAENGLRILREYEIGYHEVELRLAASEAFHAAGDLDRARAELAETLLRIQVREGDIADPVWRARYLAKNRDAARARDLARAWGVPDPLDLTPPPGT